MKRLYEGTPSKIATWQSASERTPEKASTSNGIPLAITRASPNKTIKKRSPAMPKVSTYIFCDFETNGLFKDDHTSLDFSSLKTGDQHFSALNKLCLETSDYQFPRIMEMSFIAIPAETFEHFEGDYNSREIAGAADLYCTIPTNTHTRQINPNMTTSEWIEFERIRATGNNRKYLVHSKEAVVHKNTFGEEWPAVIDFLNSCKKPAVLIAHNGLKFDFRVIFGEMKRYNLLETHPIPSDVFFVDSWAMVLAAEEKFMKYADRTCKDLDFKKLREAMNGNKPGQNCEENAEGVAELRNDLDTSDHPMRFIRQDKWAVARRRRTRNEFFRRINNGWQYDRFAAKGMKSTLSVLYSDVVGGTFTGHYAQQDAEALLHVCLCYGEHFRNFVDKKSASIPF